MVTIGTAVGRMKALVVFLFLSAAFWLTPVKCSASSAPPPASNIDPDGDDERTELLYHWQDKRFSDEERHQIATSSMLIVTLFVAGIVRRKVKAGRVRR